MSEGKGGRLKGNEQGREEVNFYTPKWRVQNFRCRVSLLSVPSTPPQVSPSKFEFVEQGRTFGQGRASGSSK